MSYETFPFTSDPRTTSIQMEPKLQIEFDGQHQFGADLIVPEKLARLERFWREYRFLDRLQALRAKRILDVGCGIGTVLHFLEGERYGIDSLADRWKTVYRYPEDIDIQQATAEDLPFDSGYFDLVVCTNAIDHATVPELAAREIHRVLTDDGLFFILTDVFDQPTQRDVAHPCSFQRQDLWTLISGRFWPIFWVERTWVPGAMEYVRCQLPPNKHTTITAFLKKLA